MADAWDIVNAVAQSCGAIGTTTPSFHSSPERSSIRSRGHRWCGRTGALIAGNPRPRPI